MPLRIRALYVRAFQQHRISVIIPIDYITCSAIHPKEALNQNWNKRKELAPNIIKMISWFNSLSKWVATQVIAREDLKARANFVKRLIHIVVVRILVNII